MNRNQLIEMTHIISEFGMDKKTEMEQLKKLWNSALGEEPPRYELSIYGEFIKVHSG